MSKLNLPIATRPKHIDSIVGHEKVKTYFKKRMKKKEYPQVMLFLGQTGVGKTTFQNIITKNILCENNDIEGNACCNCEICKSIDNSKFLLNYRVYNASNTNIEEMRDIETFLLEPVAFVSNRKKVVVIDEFQELYSNKKASKNLLKVLETPMDDVYVILGAMDESKIDKAVKDRASVFSLKPLSETEITDRLVKISQEVLNIPDITNDEEKIQVLFLIAENSGGSLRRAVSLLDTVMDSDLWKVEDFNKELNLLSYEEVNDILNKVMKGDISVLSQEITAEIFTEITYKLLTIYKILNGFDLPIWKKRYLAGLERFPKDKVGAVLEYLTGLGYYSNLTKIQLDFHFLKIVLMNKS